MITTLPETGRFIVDTASDTYDVDIDARTCVYLDLAREARGEHVEPEVFWFDTVEATVYDAMIFDAAGTSPRATDFVLGITAVPVEVSA